MSRGHRSAWTKTIRPGEHNRRVLRYVAALLCCMLAGCSTAAPRNNDGYITVPGGRIWWTRMGDGPGIPLLVIHGGPGSGSFGLKPWAALGDDRPVIRYDQLGS